MASSGYSAPPSPVFSGEGYSIWAIKMKPYLKAFDLWEVTETGRQPRPLREDPTLAQIKAHSEECAKGFKALSCIHASVSEVIFTRIMACEIAKEDWDLLKAKFQGSALSKQMSVLNLRREFEVLKMKESETLKEYTDRLMTVVNKIKLLGEDLSDKRVVEKVLVSLPDRFEPKISSLEDSKDLSKITLPELISSLQAIEQRRIIREEDASEEAFVAKQKGKQVMEVKKDSKERDNKGKQPESGSEAVKKGRFPPCPTCKRTNHLEKDCWQKNRSKQQDDHLFMASQSLKQVDKLTWIIDSGYTSHMARNEDLFTSLDIISEN
ncbi:uncharacterized protein LOC131180657 [Hevea brasiliensis]|uniref:uncharacterized protein LOC131180657 n=1 Tax=Hevea brasiliensis TaxID=3981 RepID=UPI0025F6B70F|nr:uncharacterized protein LOC131180657 [Hevea brasiliensis]